MSDETKTIISLDDWLYLKGLKFSTPKRADGLFGILSVRPMPDRDDLQLRAEREQNEGVET